MPATSKHRGVQAVPDPYYGGNDGFEMVLDLLEDACEGLLDHICRQQGLQRKDK
jgi:protein-tyrosine phosphatase